MFIDFLYTKKDDNQNEIEKNISANKYTMQQADLYISN